ncbi:hypothetical protein JCM11641_005183 [Rhodosporidiobolus odoratus]
MLQSSKYTSALTPVSSALRISSTAFPPSSTRSAQAFRRAFISTPRWDKQKLVILGSGWGGYELLRKVDKARYDVTVVSPNTYFAFTPLLASAAVGTVDYNSTLEPVRKYEQARYLQAWADKIDIKQNKLTCMPATGSANRKRVNENTMKEDVETVGPATSFPGWRPFDLHYDKLVVAVGAYSQTFGVEGVKEHAYFLKDIRDSAKIRNRILECFELAAQPTVTDDERKALLHFIIVGGGPTGVEFAGELHDFLTSDLERAYPSLAPYARITIYDTAPGILGSFDESLAQYATEKFIREGIRLKPNHHVTSVGEAHIEVEEEGKVPHGLLVWSTGLAPNPLIASIGELKHEERTHSLLVNEHFNPTSQDGVVNKDIFVIGDCSSLTEKLPATAQVASQEARWLAKILNAQVKNRDPPGPFVYNNRGAMAYIGGWSAVLDRSQANGPKGELTGRAAWLAWRSAYFSQAMSFRNKVSLVYHWFNTWLLGRRLTRF